MTVRWVWLEDGRVQVVDGRGEVVAMCRSVERARLVCARRGWQVVAEVEA